MSSGHAEKRDQPVSLDRRGRRVRQRSVPAPARLDASALGRVVVRELIIDGIVTRVLALD